MKQITGENEMYYIQVFKLRDKKYEWLWTNLD